MVGQPDGAAGHDLGQRLRAADQQGRQLRRDLVVVERLTVAEREIGEVVDEARYERALVAAPLSDRFDDPGVQLGGGDLGAW